MGLDQLRSIEVNERKDSERIRDSGISKHGKKPLMERYRRQKINNYLEELKCLVLSALDKEVSRYNKMEKADILHMAVKYVRAVKSTTTSETSPRTYRQPREFTPQIVSGYLMQSLSPLGEQSVKTNYDNSCHSSRGTQWDNTKENSTANIENERLSSIFPKATRTLNSTHGCQQERRPFQENTSTLQPLSRETMKKCAQTQTNEDTSSKIWRPW